MTLVPIPPQQRHPIRHRVRAHRVVRVDVQRGFGSVVQRQDMHLSRPASRPECDGRARRLTARQQDGTQHEYSHTLDGTAHRLGLAAKRHRTEYVVSASKEALWG